jgi:hypothetical protein
MPAAATPTLKAMRRALTGLRVRHLVGEEDPLAAFAVFDARVRAARPSLSKPQALATWYGIGLAEMNRFRETHERPELRTAPSDEVLEALDVFGARFRLVLGDEQRAGTRASDSRGGRDRHRAFSRGRRRGRRRSPETRPRVFRHVVKAAGSSYDRTVSGWETVSLRTSSLRGLSVSRRSMSEARATSSARRVFSGGWSNEGARRRFGRS